MPVDPNWKKAKDLLVQDIAGGFIPDDMDHSDVKQLQAEYRVCILENFKKNLQGLQKRMKENSDIAINDGLLLNADREMFPETGPTLFPYPRCPGSAAERLLKQDISDGHIENQKPQTVWLSCPEYQVFPLSIFCKHIYQEGYKRQAKSYWMNRQKKYFYYLLRHYNIC